MRVFEALNGDEALVLACRAVLEDGNEVSPRGQLTLELAPVSFEIADPRDPLPLGVGRESLLPAIGVAEGLQNVAGLPCPGLMSRIAAYFPKPTARWDAGIPTYAERLHDDDQLAAVSRLLARDPDSREAVVSVWRPYDVELGQAHNVCAVSLQFMLRDARLHMHVHMRSNDAWWGASYDWAQFALVQLSLANALGTEPGTYFHTAASFHLYERHWGQASRLVPPASLLLAGERDLAWAAGLWEGEGCATVQRHGARGIAATSPHLALVMTDEEPVRRFAEVVGFGCVTMRRGRGQQHKDAWCWQAKQKSACLRLRALRPYLSVRRREQLDVSLVHAAYVNVPPYRRLMGVGAAGLDWYEIRTRARDLLFGRMPANATRSERWYAETLAPYAPDGS